MPAFTSDAEHLAAELALLDLILLREAIRARRAAGHPADERGLYVSDDELHDLLARPVATPLWHAITVDGELTTLSDTIDTTRSDLEASIAATTIPLRLAHLVRTSTTPDLPANLLRPLLLLTLAPELDLRYERIVGWLHDDITRRHPSVQLALDLLAPGPAARLALLPLFGPHGPLRRQALVHTHAPHPGAPLLRHELRLAPGLLGWLAGQPSIPPSPLITRPLSLPPILRLDATQQSTLSRLQTTTANLHTPQKPSEFALRTNNLHTPPDAPDTDLSTDNLHTSQSTSEPKLSTDNLHIPLDAPDTNLSTGNLHTPQSTSEPKLSTDNLYIPLDAPDTDNLHPPLPAPAPAVAPPTTNPIFNLHGPDGAGRRTLAAALAAAANSPLYIVDGARSESLADADLDDLLATLTRAARLEHAAVAWTHFDRQRPLLARLTDIPLLLLLTHRPWHPSEPHPISDLPVPIPDLATREVLWRDALPDLPPTAHRAAADNFRFTPRQISAAAATARSLAQTHAHPAPSQPDLLQACRRHATPKLGALAAPVTTRRRWHDLVLPDEPRTQLREIVRRLQHRTRVLDEWGFGVVAAPGVAALFAGAPGTGKTMAAAIVAAECARDLYRIDLSQVVSKYIGDTEKHLETLFAEAESTDAALFFDEADAIFGKRGAIKDAHDRFANIEVGYLLQRIESFPGLVILATNLRKNIDIAFLRRLHVIVEFPAPDLTSRTAIWSSTWPPGAPLAPDVDPKLLAERFDLSGGHIRNIALTAAYAAAEADTPISLKHILEAARSEYRKLDKLMPESTFTVP